MSNAPDSAPRNAPPDGAAQFEHVIIEHPEGPDECAFVPPTDAPAGESTAWIRATGDGFIDRERMR